MPAPPNVRPQRPGQNPPPRERRDQIRVLGLHAVQALFATAPERVERLFFARELKREVEAFCTMLAAARKPFREVEGEELAKVGGSVLHGGIVAVAAPRPALLFDPLLTARAARSLPLLLCLDGIGNPHNLGAIIRTAAFFGLDRIVLSDHPAQAGASDATYRIAEGGLEHVTLYEARGFVAGLKKLKPTYSVVGTALEGGKPLSELKRDRPIALILGNEESGMSPASLAACDQVVMLPGSGRVQSLNVAATAAILIHALTQRV